MWKETLHQKVSSWNTPFITNHIKNTTSIIYDDYIIHKHCKIPLPSTGVPSSAAMTNFSF